LRKEQVKEALKHVEELEIAFGLESTNDRLATCGHKMWASRKHANAAALARPRVRPSRPTS